jgi:hypothetical protein
MVSLGLEELHINCRSSTFQVMLDTSKDLWLKIFMERTLPESPLNASMNATLKESMLLRYIENYAG